jgi:WD40 repeat protein
MPLIVASVLLVAAVTAWWLRPGLPTLPILRTLKLPGPRSWPLAFSKDGALLATGIPDRGVDIWEVASGKLHATCPLPGWPSWAVFSPDGQTVVVSYVILGPARPDTLTVFNTVDGSQRTAFEVGQSILAYPRFSQDGSKFEITTWNNVRNKPLLAPWVFRSWEATEWQEQPARPLTMKQEDAWALTSDARTMATADRKASGLTLWDLTKEEPTATALAGPASTAFGTFMLGFSPDNQTLVRVRSTGPLEIWDVGTKTRTSVLEPYTRGYQIGPMAFSTDEKTLVTQEWEPGPRPGATGMLRFLADRVMALGRFEGRVGDVVVRDLPSGRVRAVLKYQGRPVVSENGKVLATTSANGTLTLWDLSK